MDQTKPRTKEDIEFEKALKNMHELSLKKTLSEEGIDTSKIPRMKFDNIKRLLEKQQSIRQKYQEIINKAQTDAQAIINKAQTDLHGEIAEIQNEIENIIKGIKVDQGITPVPVETEKADAQEKTVPEGTEV